MILVKPETDNRFIRKRTSGLIFSGNNIDVCKILKLYIKPTLNVVYLFHFDRSLKNFAPGRSLTIFLKLLGRVMASIL